MGLARRILRPGRPLKVPLAGTGGAIFRCELAAIYRCDSHRGAFRLNAGLISLLSQLSENERVFEKGEEWGSLGARAR